MLILINKTFLKVLNLMQILTISNINYQLKIIWIKNLKEIPQCRLKFV